MSPSPNSLRPAGATNQSSDFPTPTPTSRRRRVWLGVLLAGLTLLGLGLVWVPYRPVEEPGHPPPAGAYSLPAPIPGLRLHVFNTGMNRMSSLLVGNDPPWRPAPAFVIEHPRHGLIVFDLGLSEEVAQKGEAALSIPIRWLMESRGRAERTLDKQMAEAGLDLRRASWVVISHLHSDHTGVAPLFAEATFVGGTGTAKTTFGSFSPRWREVTFPPGHPLAPFDGAWDLLGDGSVILLPGGGHAREDLMALVSLPAGPALLAGDAVVHLDWLASDDVQRIAVDPPRAAEVRNQVRALLAQRPEVALFPGHDLRGVPSPRSDIVLHHPEWFEANAWPISTPR